MKKLSAGILAYNLSEQGELKVFLVHPGGPFWKNKDEGAWSIPKGEYDEEEDPLLAAKREFTEETGAVLPAGDFIPLEAVKIKSEKVISAWAINVSPDMAFIESNQFEMEWPPRSGKKQFFAEVDRADWFSIEDAKTKINPGQLGFLEQLVGIVRLY
jgi:predicted NUDIX family NTP pyrophosphohydrolase